MTELTFRVPESGGQPTFTFIVPVSAQASLESLCDSLREQDFCSWELLLGPGTVTAAGAVASGHSDDRIVVFDAPKRDGLAGAVAAALRQARGEFVAILGTGGVLVPGSLHLLADALDGQPDVDVVYGDEMIGTKEFAKPEFSPERLRSQNYMGDFTLYRRSLLEEIGGVRSAFDGAEIYDLSLRATVAARNVLHLPAVLFSKPSLTPDAGAGTGVDTADSSIRNALSEHLTATGGGTVENVDQYGVNATHRNVEGIPLVSIVIPTRGTRAVVRGVERCLVVEAVRSVVEKSTYDNLELVIVIDDVSPPDVFSELRAIAGDQIRFVSWSKPFSFSEKMNLGVVHSRGEFVLFLNDDIEVITPDWIEAMLALAQRPKAGLVGAMLYFEDETIQHAGHAYYKLDVTHIGLNSPRGSRGPFDGFRVEREVSGVTCACALMSRELFFNVGGFSPLLPGNFNDVDLCMKVSSLGYQSYWTPRAELYHFESKSRDPRVSEYEIGVAWGRWEHCFWDSPFWPTDPHLIYPVDE